MTSERSTLSNAASLEKYDILQAQKLESFQKREFNFNIFAPAFSWLSCSKRGRNRQINMTYDGMHLKNCNKTHYHEIEDSCECNSCHSKLTRYHFKSCPNYGSTRPL